MESVNQRIFLFTFYGKDIEIIKNANRREQLSLVNTSDDISGSLALRHTEKINVGVIIYPDLNASYFFNRKQIEHSDVTQLLNFNQKQYVWGFYYNYGDKARNEFIITNYSRNTKEECLDTIQKYLNITPEKIYFNDQG
jgi:hypothetical protein